MKKNDNFESRFFRLKQCKDWLIKKFKTEKVLPCIETVQKVDMRTVSFDVAPQEVLTKDSVTVAVDAVVYYRVFNPAVSIANVENAQESTRLLAQTSLRNVLGQKSLSEILSERESVSRAMRECLDEVMRKLFWY